MRSVVIVAPNDPSPPLPPHPLAGGPPSENGTADSGGTKLPNGDQGGGGGMESTTAFSFYG